MNISLLAKSLQLDFVASYNSCVKIKKHHNHRQLLHKLNTIHLFHECMHEPVCSQQFSAPPLEVTDTTPNSHIAAMLNIDDNPLCLSSTLLAIYQNYCLLGKCVSEVTQLQHLGSLRSEGGGVCTDEYLLYMSQACLWFVFLHIEQ